jgi:hypothetical protein
MSRSGHVTDFWHPTPCRHVPGDRWFVDETYVKVAGRWVYLYRAIDQYGQVIDVLVSQKRDLAATRQFFTRALNTAHTRPKCHRSGSRVSASDRGADPHRVPRHRAVCKQSCRSRSWASAGPAPADARAETAALGTGDQYRARVRAEPPSRPLRTRLRYRSTASAHNDLHRTRPRHLIEAAQRKFVCFPPT